MTTHTNQSVNIKKHKESGDNGILQSNLFIVPTHHLKRLQAFAHQHHVSLNALLLAAFAALMYRYQNEERYDIVVKIMKSFKKSSPLPLSFNLSDQTTTYDIVNTVHESLLVDSRWEEGAEPSRLLEPFSCIFSEDGGSAGCLAAQFEVSLSGNIVITSQENTFENEIIRHWTEHYAVLLHHMYSVPDRCISRQPLLPESELETLQNWSTSLVDKDIAEPDCLHRLFEHTAQSHPRHTALRCKGGELSYEEFNGVTNALARLLRARGVGRGDHVAILLPRAQEVFIAIMGVLKAGAAYVPIDPRSPAERISYIVEDAQACLIITDSQLRSQNNLPYASICVEKLSQRLQEFSSDNLSTRETGVTPEDAAYIIYTSGTTGKPKGVVLQHKTVCNLIRAESRLFGVTPLDRVYQGFSISFDASVEEMWLAWYSGAALVAATKSEALSGPDLVTFLQTEKITVFSTVPTQISMMQTPAESVRILILGGEECHLRSIEPWLDAKRKIYNTYGPTEATVIATCGECVRGIKPRIGRPAPNYAIYILDHNLQPVPAGMYGELCIGGHCLAREYLNRQDLTDKKFVTPPFHIGHGFPQRLYRSGDRARFTPDGSIDFGGRIDDQIKLRGQRIELGEIEAALVRSSAARQAAVTLVTNSQGIQSLVAFLATENGESIDEKKLRAQLNAFLPSYMIPGKFCTIAELPVLPSGKIDRKKLSTLQQSLPVENNRDIVAPRNDLENKIHAAWSSFFDREDISVTDNFFDIGGHSLLAANIVSALREHEEMNDMPLQYIYQHRTIEALASAVGKEHAQRLQVVQPTASEPSTEGGFRRRRRGKMCGLLQALALYPLYMLFSTPLLIPFIIDWFNPSIGLVPWAVVSFISMLALLPVLTVMSIVAKWVLIGTFKPGRYPLWGFFYFRFWFVSRLMDLVPTRIMRGTPFLVWYYKLMGAKIGRNVHIGSDRFRVCDMISVGDDTSINADAHMMAYTVSDGTLHIGPISVGTNCTIGTRSVLSENTGMEDDAELGELSLLPAGQVVGKGEFWEGSPASKTMQTRPSHDSAGTSPVRGGAGYIAVFSLAFAAVVTIPTVLLLPWVIAAFYLYVHVSLIYALPATVALSALFTISFCLTVAGVKRIVFWRDYAESYDLYSITYIRKWIVDTLIQLSLFTVQPLYATIYLPHWLRLLGARIGKRAEISTVDHISADLLTLGEGSFIADSASVGPVVVRKGRMFVGKAEVGKRSFIGNSALVPIGSRVGDNCLVGVLSKPPQDCSRRIINDTNWLGSPPIVLPARQESRKFKLRLTFEPPAYMVALRGIVEFLKITMPAALTSCCYIFSYWFVSEILGPVATLRSYILLSPLVILAGSVSLALLTVMLKWLLVGRYGQRQIPLWSVYLWKNEFINSLCENMVYPLLMQMIQGTPFLPAYFRLLGSRIGKHVYMETTEITEFDLVHIEDNAVLNYGATIQTHLFEDRVMKMSHLHIGENVTVGPMAVVLYDTSIKRDVFLDGLSLLMKGETLPASTAWFGIPARSQPGARHRVTQMQK